MGILQKNVIFAMRFVLLTLPIYSADRDRVSAKGILPKVLNFEIAKTVES